MLPEHEPADSDPLYLIALQAEAEAYLGDDLQLWEETVGDGLDEALAPD